MEKNMMYVLNVEASGLIKMNFAGPQGNLLFTGKVLSRGNSSVVYYQIR